MIQVDDNTKQTQLYKNYMELVKFLHSEDVEDAIYTMCCSSDNQKYQQLLSKNLL